MNSCFISTSGKISPFPWSDKQLVHPSFKSVTKVVLVAWNPPEVIMSARNKTFEYFSDSILCEIWSKGVQRQWGILGSEVLSGPGLPDENGGVAQIEIQFPACPKTQVSWLFTRDQKWAKQFIFFFRRTLWIPCEMCYSIVRRKLLFIYYFFKVI